MEAADASAVIDNLQSSGYLPITTREIDSRKFTRDLLSFSRRRVARNDLLDMTRELGTMLDAGLPLSQALDTLTSLATRPAVRDLLDEIRVSVEAGASLSQAMEQAGGPFSSFYLSLVRAGEASGALELVLRRLSEHLQRSQQLREAVLSAMLYPAILLFVAGGSLIVLLIYVVPQFEPLFEDLGQSLPVSTQIVIALAHGLRHYWWALLVLALAAYVAGMQIRAQQHFKFAVDSALIRIPLVGNLIIRIELTRVFRTLGTLTANGVTLLDAMRIVSGTAVNGIISQSLEEAGTALEQGRGLSQSLADAPWFPQLAVQLIHVGEETGTLASMLLRLADIYDAETQSAIKRLLALLEPVLILGLGLLIAFIIISILLAILGLNELVL